MVDNLSVDLHNRYGILEVDESTEDCNDSSNDFDFMGQRVGVQHRKTRKQRHNKQAVREYRNNQRELKRERAKIHDITRQKTLLKQINQECERKISPLVSATTTCGGDSGGLSRIEIDGEVGGQPCIWLIDTGAEISVISENLASMARGHRVPPHYTPHTVDGSDLGTVCDLVTTCRVGKTVINEHCFTVVQHSTYEAIIGMDLFPALNVTMSLNGQPCYQGSKDKTSLPHQTDCTPTICRIYASTNITVPANSMHIVEGVIKGKVTVGQLGIVESLHDQGLERFGIGCGRVLDTVHKDCKVLMHVTNPRGKASRITKGTCIGTFSTKVENSTVISSISMSSEEKSGVQHPQADKATRIDRMARKLSNSAEISESAKHRLYKVIKTNADVFSVDGDLGRTDVIEHVIPTGVSAPQSQPVRRVPFHKLQEVDEFVQDGLSRNIIRPSRSPWASPLVLVKKTDGSTRFCVDFRKLNEVTVGDSFPIPRIDDSLRALHGAQIFTTLDLTKGYWQVPVKEADREKTAFNCHRGLYEFNTMPFGLKGAPATFQRLMSSVLGEFNWKILLIYLDDVVIYSRSLDEHFEHLNRVFEKIRNAGLKLQPTKCAFARKQVRYLGHIVSRCGVEPDPEKVRAIREFPRPITVSDLRRFLGMASYYRRFISGFAEIAQPLHALTEKDTPFQWSPNCEEAFQKLLHCLSSTPVLGYPDFQQQFVVETDASNIGLGAVLRQENAVIEYASRTLNKAERNYSATEKECLGVVWALQKFAMYLEGSPFKVITDHKPLTYLLSLKEPRGKLARWRVELDTFDFEIEHRPGKLMAVPDALSRAPVVGAVNISGLWSPYELMCLQQGDDEVGVLYKWAKSGYKLTNINQRTVHRAIQEHGKNFVIQDGILVLNVKQVENVVPRVVIPVNTAEMVLETLHDRSGHFGYSKTLAKVKSSFFWFGLQKDVKAWCKSCEVCLKRKNPTVPDHQPVGTLPIPDGPCQWWHMDVVGPLVKTTNDNRYLLVLTDPFSKWPEAFAMPNQTAKTTADKIYQGIVCRYGVPEGLHADQGRNFEANLMKELCQRLGIKRTRSSPFNPQGNGQAERTNRTLAERLAMDLDAMDQSDWDEKLPSALAAIRTAPNSTTGESPYFLLFGTEARTIADVVHPKEKQEGGQPQDANEFRNKITRLQDIHQKVKTRVMDEHAKRHKRQEMDIRFTPFKEGEKVWMYGPPPKKGLSKKLLAERWRGPYVVTKKLGETLYKIRLEKGKRHTKIVNHRRLKRHYERPKHLVADIDGGSEVDTGAVSSEESDKEDVVDLSTEGESSEGEERAAPADQRPRRQRNPPLRLTYGLDGEQIEFRNLMDDSD